MLNEFAWSKEGDSDKEVLNCQISITEDGRYEVRSHDGSKSETFDSAEELGEAISSTLRDRSNR